MPTDLAAWRKVVEQVVDAISDEALQRRAWFGIGPEVWSPDEAFTQLFDDAAIEAFLDRPDVGLSNRQLEAGKHLVDLMEELSGHTPQHIDPADLIDDPRWQAIRAAAARFTALLKAGAAL